jgi:hypothetical protein
MATQPATPMQPRRKMRELKAPEMFKFTKQGQMIEGVLIRLEPVVVKNESGHSETIEYTFRVANGERLTFLGTNDLNKKIQPEYIGYWHEVRYERDDDSFRKPGQSAAKIFKVTVAEEKEPGF